MKKIVIFGGTTEGRRLAEYCICCRQPAVVCVASEYGSAVLPESPFLEIEKGRMDEAGMCRFLMQADPELVLDATHPYATAVSDNVRAACGALGIICHRVLRPEQTVEAKAMPEIYDAEDTGEAVRILSGDKEAVLLTTGSKELADFCVLPGFAERIYARVLPDSGVLAQCEAAGIRGKHLIAMQGPFSAEMNEAMLRQIQAGWLVTKESGGAGGYAQKLQAAAACGVKVLVIGRPVRETGISVEEACRRIKKERRLSIVGIGVGNLNLLTCRAREVIAGSDAVLGAARMLEAVSELTKGCVTAAIYKSSDIADWLTAHPDCVSVSVCYSGDTGFYSGAQQLFEALKHEKFDGDVEVIPGISSVSYLFARLCRSWQDVYLTSAHGRDCEVERLVREHERVFMLFGGDMTWQGLCDRLISAGLGDVSITLGENLSYPEECIRTGTPESMRDMQIEKLAAVFVEAIKKDGTK